MPAKQFRPNSRQVKYDKKTQLWIPNRKRVYLYWFRFLQLALSEMPNQVNMNAYSSWGTVDEILNTKFDEWWSKHWVDLFGYPEGEQPKFSISTNRPKADAYRYALLVYTNRHRGTNLEIAQWVYNREMNKRGYGSPSLGDFDAEEPDGRQVVQSRVGRYMRQAEKILSNVCQGIFP